MPLFKKILYRLGLDVRPLSRRLRAIEIALRSEAEQARVQNLLQRVEQLELLLLGDPLPPPEPQALRQAGYSSPVVSVLLPLHNRVQGIVQAIASVQAQRFTDWELIVVDDGSTDGSAQAVARLTTDSRIRYFRQEHQGAAVALNRALNEVRGALIAHLDSDNLWYPDFLAVVVAAFAADPALQCAYGALVSDIHSSTGERILFQTFDRKRLLKQNFIDRSTFVHRQSMVAKYGGFDETLTRLIDWDFVLRYTRDAPARCLPVLAARYRVIDDQRISAVDPYGPNYFRVRRKWRPARTLPRPLRVLYVVWKYPQLSETYIETEIRCMKHWGVHVEVWSESCGASPFQPTVPVHYGSLDQAIAEARPDLLHVHWVSFAESHQEVLRKAGLPLTVRAHGFDTNDARLEAVLSLATLRRVFCFPHQIPSTGAEPRFQPLRAAFDTTLFRSQPNKDRRLVVRTAAALPSKDLQRFFQIAKRLPENRFVLALVTCSLMEPYVDELRSLWRQQGCPGELMVDVPRERLAPLVQQAGLYLHTALLTSEPGGAPIGMPISIAEAMATGAHILVREGTPLIGYVGDAGSGYRDTDHAVQLIAETAQWSDSRWKQAWTRSVDRAYSFHADELALLPIYEEWCAILGKRLEVEPPAGGPTR